MLVKKRRVGECVRIYDADKQKLLCKLVVSSGFCKNAHRLVKNSSVDVNYELSIVIQCDLDKEKCAIEGYDGDHFSFECKVGDIIKICSTKGGSTMCSVLIQRIMSKNDDCHKIDNSIESQSTISMNFGFEYDDKQCFVDTTDKN